MLGGVGMARKKSRQTGPIYFTTFQVAKYLGVSAPTVVNWVNSGLLLAHRTPGGHRRIKREDIVAFAKEHEYPLSAELLNGAAPTSTEASGGQKVLIVDDDPDFNAVVRAFLEARGGFDVECAESGFSAGLTVARFRPQVILMDIWMPDMDGVEVLRMLQGDPEMREIPVIACTSVRDAHTEERVRRERFVGYVEKPLDLSRLVAVISDAIAGRTGMIERRKESLVR